MAETYLNLLNNAAQVSAQVYQQIDQSMTKRLEIESQAGQFQVNAMAKAASFAEQQRMNDEQIINMRTNNYLQAQRLEAEKQLIPVKLQAANLQLESQRLALQRQKEAEGKSHFNDLTSIYDDQMGYKLLETESTDMAQEYLGFKARVADYVSKGGKFDSAQFEAGLAAINSKYSGTKGDVGSNAEYSAEKNYLFDQISPKLGAAYATRHPAVQGSRNSLAVSYYSAESAKEAAEFAKYSKLYTQEEIGLMSVGRTTYLRNVREIDTSNKQADYLRNQIAITQAKDGPDADVSGMAGSLKVYEDKVKRAINENEALIINASQGKFGSVRNSEENKVDNKPVATKPFTDDTAIAGVVRAKNPDIEPVKQAVHEGLQNSLVAVGGASKDKDGNITPVKSYYDTELSQIDMEYWQKQNTGEVPDLKARSYIKEKAEEGIERMIPKGKSVNVVATKEKITNLLATIKGDISIPVSDTFSGSVTKDGNVITGREYLSNEPDDSGSVPSSPTVTFGPKNTGIFRNKSAIRSADELFAMVNKAPAGPIRENALKELYGALISASQSSGVTTSVQ